MDVREQLLEAAVKVFAHAGFRGATTRRIAQEAGVNEVTLFRQFGSKEGLILEAVLRAVTRLQDEAVLPDVPRDPAAELLDWTRRHYEFMLGNNRLIKAAMADAVAHPDMGCLGDRITTSIEQTLRAYIERLRDAQPQDIAQIMLDLYNEIIPPAERLNVPLLPPTTAPGSGTKPTLPPVTLPKLPLGGG